MSLRLDLIQDLFKRIIGPFAATQVGSLMVEPDTSEERVKLLADVFNLYPHLLPPFSALIKSLKVDEEDVVLEEKIRFYNTRHTRNWLIVNLMNQVLNVKDLKLDEASGRLPGKPHALIHYANQCQVEFGEESRYKDLAFAGGLLFDFFFYLQRTHHLDLGQTKFDDVLDKSFNRAVEQGLLILKLSRHKSKLALERYTFLTALMRQLSQVALHLLKPNEAPEFYRNLNNLKHTETIRMALEIKTFGANAGLISTYLAQALPSFGELGQAMSIWGAPYLAWVHGQKEIHDLSGMGLLGVSLQERVKSSAFTKSSAIGPVIPELSRLDFSLSPEVRREVKI